MSTRALINPSGMHGMNARLDRMNGPDGTDILFTCHSNLRSCVPIYFRMRIYFPTLFANRAYNSLLS
jgi:hypothetical protein